MPATVRSPYGGNAGDGGNIAVVNQGTVEGGFAGIVATAAGNNSAVTIVNAGTVKGGATGIYAATGIETFIPCGCYYGPPIFIPSGYGNNSPLTIINSGIIDPDIGISALTLGANSPIEIKNSGKIEATFTGIAAATYGAGSGINIVNSGSIYGGYAGILAGELHRHQDHQHGQDFSRQQLRHRRLWGERHDLQRRPHHRLRRSHRLATTLFINQKGGVFETKLTSYFGLGNDLFVNEQGGTVLAATDPSVKETSGFEGLERFENKGLITLQDDAVGDVFFIANTLWRDA